MSCVDVFLKRSRNGICHCITIEFNIFNFYLELLVLQSVGKKMQKKRTSFSVKIENSKYFTWKKVRVVVLHC